VIGIWTVKAYECLGVNERISINFFSRQGSSLAVLSQ
jgi:hypothetical protein